MGTQLARLHKIEQPFFGWVRDNCIGSTPQPNPRNDNWVQFYQQHRLQHQLQLAASKGRSFEKAEVLLLNLEFFFQDYAPHPSLLHGDLGEEMPVKTFQAFLSFMILPAITEIERRISLLLTCLADSVLLSTRRMKKNSL